MGRPKETDPRLQRNVYPRASVWDRLCAMADTYKRRPAELAVLYIEAGLERDEKAVSTEK